MGHISEKELSEKYATAKAQVEVGARYVHYRTLDRQYEVREVGFLEENEEPVVVYKALYGEGLVWVRKLSSFCEKVEYEGNKVSRFRKLE